MKRLLSRVIPAPLITLLLIIIWLMLTQSLSRGNVLLALLLGYFIPFFSEKLRPQYVRVRHPLTIARLFCTIVIDALRSNYMVVRILLQPSLPRNDTSIFIRIPLDIRDPNGLAVLAVIVTIAPGNAWAELALDRSTLLLHVFDGNIDENEVIDTIKQRYERPLMEIFE